jgi:hypothetical protein
MMRAEPSRQWAARITGDFPPSWQAKILGQWDQRAQAHGGGFVEQIEAERNANLFVLGTVAGLDVVRLPLDASDWEICQAADDLAGRASEVAFRGVGCFNGSTLNAIQGRQVVAEDRQFSTGIVRTAPELRAALDKIAMGWAITPPELNIQDGPAIARLTDPQWWRRQLRRVHAKHVEGAAINLGYVNKAAQPYASNQSVKRRAEQNERNAAALEATTMTNEDGDQYTLAELAAKGVANRSIRRAELMTRIAGFERIANDLGHVGLFATMTCPSYMHKWTVKKGAWGVVENRKYRGTLPNEAQKYLGKVWARIRAKLARLGIKVYGFRIAEPNHDGTPHWHLLLFVAPLHLGALKAVMWSYNLQEAGDEKGALEHRVDLKDIDPKRGSAAGYIAKYVAKNIDGHRLTTDLCGGVHLEADGIQTAHRVETWASTWNIRQFQQIGGPPVTVWRELRRVESMPGNAPQFARDAWAAVNRIKTLGDKNASGIEPEVITAACWAKYVKAQGGVFCGRNYRIRLEKTEVDGLGKYGEPMAPVPVGVSCLEGYTPAHMAWMPECSQGRAERRLVILSKRHTWTKTTSAARAPVSLTPSALAPWTRVNNCTEDLKNEPRTTQRDPKSSGTSRRRLGQGARPYQSDGRGLHGADPGSDSGRECGA